MSARLVTLSPEQLAVLDAIHEWLHDPERLELSLGGFAGTGKTTLLREVVRLATGMVAVVAFTGKAAFVLRQKGIEQATTLHRLIYDVMEVCRDCGRFPETCADHNVYERGEAKRENRRPRLCPGSGVKTRYRAVDSIPHDLVIVDEASMLSARLAADLRSLGTKLLFVGDHGQLEPVGSDAGLMRNPDLRLETIHRQAAGNPIVMFAHELRRGTPPASIEVLDAGADRLRICSGLPSYEDLVGFDMVLCGFNETRVAVNRKIRQLRGHVGRLPNVGERVICLRNKHREGLFNGMLGEVLEIHRGQGRISIHTEDGRDVEGIHFADEQFGAARPLTDLDGDYALFDYGYCVTVHKAQGSEWDNVCVLEQLMPNWSAQRWRYTAATRAAQRLQWCTSERRRR